MAFAFSSVRRLSLQAGLLAAGLSALAPALAQSNDAAWADVRKAGVLRCGAAVAAPYVMRDARSGQYSGFFSDLCREFGEKELKVKVEFVDTNWDNLVAGVQAGSWDLAMALNETPERKKAVNFTAAAVDYQVSFLVNTGNPKFSATGNTLADFDKAGVRFVVMSGTSQDKLLTASIRQGQIQRLPGMDETRLALVSKRADVLVDANDTNRLFAVANPGKVREVLLQPTLGKQPVAFGLSLNRSEADIRFINDYINRRRANGEIEALVDKAAKAAVEATKAR
ncbi:MAG: hypothetical protein RLY78_3923 [Pseudomonadota bacterium]|jgi:polar amino acid transport system substrate-binding protein|uniref:Transporter substrate-binding domain-containing protein n=1 Tax=Pseudaquabacterium rugosum TaxID=2984194 RepID=A0ABU9BDM4_9BURK